MHEFFIAFIVIERYYRDAIVKLVPERVNCVIHDNHVFEVPVCDDTQILDVNALLSTDAMISIKSVLNESAIGI